MDLILFLVKTRAHNFLRDNSWLELFWIFLGLIVFGLQAAAFGYFLDHPVENVEEITTSHLVSGLFSFITVFTVVRGFMPYFKPKADFLSWIYPLSQQKRYFAGLAWELFSPYFLISIFLFLVITAVSNFFGIEYLTASILLLIASHLIRRILQVYLGRKVKKDGYLILSAAFVIFGAMGIVFCVSQFTENQQFLLLRAFATCILLLVADFITEAKCMQFESLKLTTENIYRGNVFFALILQFKKFRRLFVVSILFKLFIFLFDYNSGFGLMDEEEHLYNIPYLGMQVFSCSMWFFAVFNNTWGSFKNLWLTAERSGASQWQLVKIKARLLAIPLLLDALLTLLLVLILNEDLIFYSVYYVCVVAFGFPIAIISSIYKPVKITENLQQGKQSSVLFMIIMMVVPMIMLVAKKKGWMYYSYPLFIICAVFCAFAVLKEYRKFRYNLYAVLHKDKE